MTAAVNNLTEARRIFSKNYQTLLRQYGLEGGKVRWPAELRNGDRETRAYRFVVRGPGAVLGVAAGLRGSEAYGGLS